MILGLRIWNYFKGYVVIKIEGINLERFINLAVIDNIYFWDIKRVDFVTLTAKVSLRGYKQLCGTRKGIRYRVSILEKRGCPFLLHKVSKRKALVAGGVIAVLIMYFLTSFVWVVEINGNKNVSDEMIIGMLESFGLKPGTFKPFINTREMETKLLIEVDQLVWAGINILGTKALVDIVERVEPPPLIDKNIPCNIVAKKDGIIVNMYVFEGQEAVESGDTVQVGQVLINGIVEDPDKPYRTVHAMGRVEARTWYQLTEEQSLKVITRERTGRIEKRVSIRVKGKSLTLNPKECRFPYYDTVIDINPVIKWRDITSPVELVTEKYYEVMVEEEALPEKIAVARAVKKTIERLTERISREAEIIDSKIRYIRTYDDTIKVEVVFEILEDIGMEEKIDISYRED